MFHLKSPTTALIDVLSRAITTVSPRDTIPILQNVAIYSHSGKTVIRATNTDEYVSIFSADITVTGSVAIHANSLIQKLKTVRTDTVEIESDGKIATVKSGRSSWKIPVLPVDDLPAQPACAAEKSNIHAADFTGAINRHTVSASKEAARHYLTGVRVDGGDVVATTGHILSAETGAWDLPAITIPTQSAKNIARIFDKSEFVNVAANENIIEVSDDSIVYTSKLIDGQYPDYNRIIPTPGENTATLSIEQILEIVSFGNSVSEATGIQIEIIDTGLNISVTSKTENAETSIDCLTNGAAKTYINPRYLADMASVLSKSDTVEICISDPSAPVMINSVAGSIRTLIMPMRLK